MGYTRKQLHGILALGEDHARAMLRKLERYINDANKSEERRADYRKKHEQLTAMLETSEELFS